MWFVWWDACGLACFLFGELTMIFCNYSTVFEIILPWFGASSPWAWVNIIAFEALLVLVHWSHWMAAVVKPGHVVPGKVSKRSRRSQPLAACGPWRAAPAAATPKRGWRKRCFGVSAALQGHGCAGGAGGGTSHAGPPVLQQVLQPQAPAGAPLQHLWRVRDEDGPPLPVSPNCCSAGRPPAAARGPRLEPVSTLFRPGWLFRRKFPPRPWLPKGVAPAACSLVASCAPVSAWQAAPWRAVGRRPVRPRPRPPGRARPRRACARSSPPH